MLAPGTPVGEGRHIGTPSGTRRFPCDPHRFQYVIHHDVMHLPFNFNPTVNRMPTPR